MCPQSTLAAQALFFACKLWSMKWLDVVEVCPLSTGSSFICELACIHYGALLQNTHSRGQRDLSLPWMQTKTKWGKMV